MSSGQKAAYEDAMEEAHQARLKKFQDNNNKHFNLAENCIEQFRYLDIDALRLTRHEWSRLNAIKQNLNRMFGYE